MTTTTKPRGFAALPAHRVRAIAAKGGQAAHARGLAYEWTPAAAAAAGRKGGRSVARNRKHMSEIGRRGVQARLRKVRADG